jgi:hypothetical protein
MSENQEKIFADGFIFKRRDNAPEFVIGNLSIKVDEAITFLKKYEKKGWVNMGIKKGRSGNTYIELDTYEAKPKGPTPPAPPAEETPDENLPF